MEYKDYYAVLGLPRTASQAEVKKAFRKLARQHHPDAKPGDSAAERKFKDVNEANEVLGDPAKRKQYDELGANWEAVSRARAAGGPGGFGGSRTGTGGNVRYEFRPSGEPGEFSDFFRVFFGEEAAASRGDTTGNAPAGGSRSPGAMGFDDILAGMGISGRPTGTSRSASGPIKSVHEATAEITLDEAYHGTTRLVDVDAKRLEITIPPGAETGTRIKLTGRGPGGGDLIVVVRLTPDSRFTRRGADLDRDLTVTLEQAVLGGEITVETLKGRLLLTIPPGTQPGRTFRLTGQGMPRFKKAGHGDLYVRARVLIPADLSEDGRVAARTFFALIDQPDPSPADGTKRD